MIQITWHEIGTAQVDLFIPAVSKIKDPAMFEKAADNTPYPDILANPI